MTRQKAILVFGSSFLPSLVTASTTNAHWSDDMEIEAIDRPGAECPRCGNYFGLGWQATSVMADAISSQAARVAELEAAARRAVEIIDANLYHQREKVEDAAAILRAALYVAPKINRDTRE